MNLKQIFCEHIWKTVSSERLRTIRRHSLSEMWWGTIWDRLVDYGIYADKKECLKCGKREIFEVEKLLIDN